MTKVFVAGNHIQLQPAQIAWLSRDMPPEVHDKAAKYRRWQDAQAFLWGRYLLATALQYFNLDKNLLQQIQYTAYNKPYLPIPFDFNISHAGDYVVCAFAATKTGIDMEQIRPVTLDDFTGCFTVGELNTIQQAPNIYREFFRHWTIKEAVIKADGKGLSIPLDTISVADKMQVAGNTWFIHPLDIAPGYMTHLATNAPHTAIEIEQVSI